MRPLNWVLMSQGWCSSKRTQCSGKFCNSRDTGSVPESGTSPGGGHGNPLQCSCLENPVDRGAWRAAVQGVTRVGHDLATKQEQKDTVTQQGRPGETAATGKPRTEASEGPAPPAPWFPTSGPSVPLCKPLASGLCYCNSSDWIQKHFLFIVTIDRTLYANC